ncbi:MAG: hypothetical protein Q9169_005678 [Polycauliona sp. 2 TL-2023]
MDFLHSPYFPSASPPSAKHILCWATSSSRNNMAISSIRTHKAEAALQYAAPAIILLYYLSSISFAVFTLQIGRKKKHQRLRHTTIWCVRLILLTYLAQCGDLLADSLSAHPTTSTLAANVNAASSALLWYLISIILQGTSRPVWYPYHGTCLTTLAFEATTFSLFASQLSKNEAVGLVFAGCHICRFAILLFYLAVHQKAQIDIRHSRFDEESAASLLQHHLRSAKLQEGATKSAGDYGSIVVTDASQPETADSDDSEESEPDDEARKEQKKKKRLMNQRLRKAGNWFSYVRGFSLFVPMIWPTKRSRLYLNMLACVLCVLCNRVFNVLQPRQLGIVVNILASGTGSLYPAVALYVFYYWIPGVIGTARYCLWLPVEQYADAQIPSAAYSQIMRLSSEFHDNKQSGELYSTISQGRSISDLLETICWLFVPKLLDIVIGYGYLYHLFGPYMALLAAATTVAYLSSATQLNRTSSKYRRKYRALSRNEFQTMYDSVGSWATVSYFNRVPHEERKYQGAVSLNLAAQYLYFLCHFCFSQISSSIVTLGFAAALCIAAYQVVHGGQNVGSFVTLLTYWSIFSAPLTSFGPMHKQILEDLIDAEQLLQLFQTEFKIKDGGSDFVMKEGAIAFENVHFSYDGTKQIIKNVSFLAQPGQKIALVGETGGGKSTLLKLLFRFYDVSEGSVLIDGQDVRGVTLESLRSHIGVVPQHPSMFNDTVMNNVRYSKLEATDEEVMEACKAAVVHDKILSFTDGYQCIVGEKGVKLSGGELQRLAIARAILKNPAIILLDEATSSVDTDTESRIQSALHELTKGRTTFTVAHRLSTIVDADVVLVIKDGEIVEQGSPHELLAAKKEYYHLWCKQVGITSKMIDATDATKPKTHTRSESEQAQSGLTENGKRFRPDAPEFIPGQLKGSTTPTVPASKQKAIAKVATPAGPSEQRQSTTDDEVNGEGGSWYHEMQANGNGNKAIQKESENEAAEEHGVNTSDGMKTLGSEPGKTQKYPTSRRTRRRKTPKGEEGGASANDTSNTKAEGAEEESATQQRRVSAPSTSTDNGKTSRQPRHPGHKWGRKRNMNSDKSQSAPGTWSGLPPPTNP